MRIKKPLIFIILLCSIALLFHRHIEVTSFPNTGIVKEVIDGDTIRLSDGKLIRYIGIDTPEVRSRKGEKWNYNPQPYAIEAKKFNQQLVKEKRVRIETDKEKMDKYGRVLGYVYPLEEKSDLKEKGFLETLWSYLNFFQGEEYEVRKMVNAKILKAGYGVIYIKPPNLKYIDRLVEAQEIATEKKRGMWEKNTILPKGTGDYMGEAVVVKGKLKNMINKGEVVVLKFSENPNFELVIFKSNLVFFRKEKKLINEYLDEFVTAYGMVEDYKGTPQIVINHPCQLKILK